MPIDVATAAADYLPIVETLNKVFERASKGPLTRNELDSVWVTLPPEGRLSSAGICRLALKRLGEVLDYKYMLRNEVDATPQELSDAGNDMKEIFGTIFKCVPKASTLLNSPGILDRYFYALGILADLLYALGSVEHTRIKAGPAIDQSIQRHKEKVQNLRRSLVKRLKEIAAREKITHAEIAKRAGTSRTRVTAILNDDLQHVSSDLLIRITSSLGYRVRVSVVRSSAAK